MGVYVAVAKQSFRRQSTYRAAMVAGIFTNAVFGVILASVLLAAFGSQTEINGPRCERRGDHHVRHPGILLTTASFGWTELSDRVRTGDIATDLQRPVDVSLYWMAMFIGASAFAAFDRTSPRAGPQLRSHRGAALARVGAVTRVRDLTLEEPAIEDIVRRIYVGEV